LHSPQLCARQNLLCARRAITRNQNILCVRLSLHETLYFPSALCGSARPPHFFFGALCLCMKPSTFSLRAWRLCLKPSIISLRALPSRETLYHFFANFAPSREILYALYLCEIQPINTLPDSLCFSQRRNERQVLI
jgi:hypothetical protein